MLFDLIYLRLTFFSSKLSEKHCIKKKSMTFTITKQNTLILIDIFISIFWFGQVKNIVFPHFYITGDSVVSQFNINYES